MFNAAILNMQLWRMPPMRHFFLQWQSQCLGLSQKWYYKFYHMADQLGKVCKLKVSHRVVLGLFLFVCFFLSFFFFPASPRRLIDFPQAGCSRACFLLLDIFWGGQWNHLMSDLNREGERNLKRLLGPILPSNCAQEPKGTRDHLSPDVTRHQYCLIFMKWIKSVYVAAELNRTRVSYCFPWRRVNKVSYPSKNGHKEIPSVPHRFLKNQVLY